MKAITLHQPWASLIALGKKQYETRSWPAPPGLCGEMLAIHAGQKCDDEALKQPVFWHALGEDPIMPHGCIVCVVRLEDVLPTGLGKVRLNKRDEWAFGDFSPGRYAWKLELIAKLAAPIPCRGQQRLWDLPPTVGHYLAEHLTRTGQLH